MSNQEWRRHQLKQMDKLKKCLMLLLVATLSLTFTSCGGDDNDEPDIPTSKVPITPNLLKGTWKGVFKDYTGIRDELITIYWSDNSLQIWWTHYKNVGEYYFTGSYSVKGNMLTLSGKYGSKGHIVSYDYERTVPIEMSKDHNTIKFEFDCDTWILTRR